MKFLPLITFITLSCNLLSADENKQEKAAHEVIEGRYNHYSQGTYLADIVPHWINNGDNFWYVTWNKGVKQFHLVKTDTGEKSHAFDYDLVVQYLNKELSTSYKANDLPFNSIEYSSNSDSISFVVDNTRYVYTLATKNIEKENPTPPSNDQKRPKQYGDSVDGKWHSFIKDHNVHLRNIETKEEFCLTTDGREEDFYTNEFSWSPDSLHLVVCKSTKTDQRLVTLVKSSPSDQIQPKTKNIPYTKPGDPLPVRRPCLININTKSVKEISFPDQEKQYYAGNWQWSSDGTYFTFDFNKRGHDAYIIYKVTTDSSVPVPAITEKSDTFISYTKLFRHIRRNNKEALWISERDGWRHLYLMDMENNSVKRQITSGSWVVKRIMHVDEDKGVIFFIGCGKDSNEDPYYEKLYKVSLSGGEPVCLTPEPLNHKVFLSPNNTFIVSISSTPVVPPTVALRNADTGKILLNLENSDIQAALDKGWRSPLPFMAKGRDGETDIWGLIQFPPNFDSNKKYPVIEHIYAGPHDSFVPKNFHFAHTFTEMAELGFITVMIDGMGTANRSKKFHDVCWKNLKDSGFPDRILWMKASAKKYPSMDLDRVGIYGMSAGGQSSLAAMLFHPDFYKAAYSSCGCHDNRMDKIWWNEQWMGFPIGKQYEDSSNVVHAHKLQGKLMLVVGELDDNVDPSSTLQVVNALIKAEKDFEFIMIPGAKHTMGGRFGLKKQIEFFRRHLMDTPPVSSFSKN